MSASRTAATSPARTLTKRMVEALRPGGLAWDGTVKGFGVRCQTGSSKTYFVKYRAGGRQRWYSIGKHGSPWTVEKARSRALAVLGQVAEGKDPAGNRAADKIAPTVKGIVEKPETGFLAEHVEKLKPRTAQDYQRLLNNVILPAIGRLRVADVTKADISAMHLARKRTPYEANHALRVASVFFTWAEANGHRPVAAGNPCRHVKLYKEKARERYLSEAELARLGDALAEAESNGSASESACAAIRLLLFTGARRGEILTLRWEYVDFERNCLRLPDSKTGSKEIHLSPPALAALASLKRIQGNPYVLPGLVKDQPLADIKRPWHRIRDRAAVAVWAEHGDGGVARLVDNLHKTLGRAPTVAECRKAASKAKLELPAGMSNVRLHDLRHSFASVGAGAGLSLPIIGKLLGHRQQATTQRYSHLSDNPIKAANDAIGKRIADAMKAGKPKSVSKVVPLKTA